MTDAAAISMTPPHDCGEHERVLRHHWSVQIARLPEAFLQTFGIVVLFLATLEENGWVSTNLAATFPTRLEETPILVYAFLGAASFVLASLFCVLFALGSGYLKRRFQWAEIGATEVTFFDGILFRTERNLPLQNVQSVTLRQTIMHRLTGTAEVVIDTAIHGEGEARLPVCTLEQARTLERSLAKHASRDKAPLIDSSIKTALLYGMTEFRGAPILIALGAVFMQISNLPFDLRETLLALAPNSLVYMFEIRMGWDLSHKAFQLFVGGVVFLFAAWLISIASAMNMLTRFRLRYSDGQFTREFGLLETKSQKLARPRIQFLRIESSPLRQLLGLSVVHEGVSGEARDFKNAEVPLVPLASPATVADVSALSFDGFDLDAVRWQPVSNQTIKRGFLRYVVALGVLGGIGAQAVSIPFLPVICACLLLAGALAYWRWRTLGFAVTENFVCLRTGPFVRRLWIVPLRNIQYAGYSSGPFQRRVEIATLKLGIAGTGFLRSALLPDLPLNVARELSQFLTETAAKTKWSCIPNKG